MLHGFLIVGHDDINIGSVLREFVVECHRKPASHTTGDGDHKNGKVVVEGVNMMTKHTKPNAANQAGGIVTTEAPIDASNVMVIVDGKATRVGFKVEDGKKVRVAKSTGKVID